MTSMARYNIAEAKAKFSSVVKKALAGEEVLIAKDNQVLLKLVRVTQPKVRRRLGLGKKDVLHIADDFDAPIDDFGDDA